MVLGGLVDMGGYVVIDNKGGEGELEVGVTELKVERVGISEIDG